MFNYATVNDSQLTAFFNRARALGQDVYSIKGFPPSDAVFSDGTPCTIPVNVAWVNSTTGERIDIVRVKVKVVQP